MFRNLSEAEKCHVWSGMSKSIAFLTCVARAQRVPPPGGSRTWPPPGRSGCRTRPVQKGGWGEESKDPQDNFPQFSCTLLVIGLGIGFLAPLRQLVQSEPTASCLATAAEASSAHSSSPAETARAARRWRPLDALWQTWTHLPETNDTNYSYVARENHKIGVTGSTWTGPEMPGWDWAPWGAPWRGSSPGSGPSLPPRRSCRRPPSPPAR